MKKVSRIITPVISKFLVKVMDAIEKVQRSEDEPNSNYKNSFHCGLTISQLFDPILLTTHQRSAFVDAVTSYFREEEVELENKDPPPIKDDGIELPF